MTRFRRGRQLTPHAWLTRPETLGEWAKRVASFRGHD